MDHLFRSKGSTAQLQADAAAYGVILEGHHLQSPDYRLWAEHWPAVELFMRCQTQWRATSSGVVGLDYGVLLAIAPMLGRTMDAALLDEVQTMELHARELINRR